MTIYLGKLCKDKDGKRMIPIELDMDDSNVSYSCATLGEDGQVDNIIAWVSHDELKLSTDEVNVSKVLIAHLDTNEEEY